MANWRDIIRNGMSSRPLVSKALQRPTYSKPTGIVDARIAFDRNRKIQDSARMKHEIDKSMSGIFSNLDDVSNQYYGNTANEELVLPEWAGAKEAEYMARYRNNPGRNIASNRYSDSWNNRQEAMIPPVGLTPTGNYVPGNSVATAIDDPNAPANIASRFRRQFPSLARKGFDYSEMESIMRQDRMYGGDKGIERAMDIKTDEGLPKTSRQFRAIKTNPISFDSIAVPNINEYTEIEERYPVIDYDRYRDMPIHTRRQ
jgi:hypothetical protein